MKKLSNLTERGHCRVFLFLCLLCAVQVFAQTPNDRAELQQLAKQNGEVFIAVEYPHAEQAKNCRLEDVFTNTVSFAKDSLTVDFDNYTESFCEATKLETHLLYRVRLSDLDPTKTVLVQRKYNLKTNKLLEGEPVWYEVQANTVGGKPLAKEQNLLEPQTRLVNQFRIIFKTQESAKRALTLLRRLSR